MSICLLWPRTILTLEGHLSDEKLEAVKGHLAQFGVAPVEVSYEGAEPPVSDYEDMSPEELRENIGKEAVRVFEEVLPKKTDWTEHRSLMTFGITGEDTPAWLRDRSIMLTTDASVIKIVSAKFQCRANQYDSGSPLAIGSLTYPSASQPISQPFIHKLANGEGETLDEFQERMNGSHGYDYADLREEYLPSLFQTMRQLGKYYDIDD